jgi:hypothetical protein
MTTVFSVISQDDLALNATSNRYMDISLIKLSEKEASVLENAKTYLRRVNL